MHFICRSFIGKNNPDSWSQYWENEPDDQLQLTKGHLFGLINLKNKQSEDVTTIGHDIIFEINQLYFSQESNDINLSLKNTLSSFSQNPIFLNYQIDLILVVVFNHQVFLATFGNSSCILQRNSQISLILSGQTNQISCLFGPIKDNDRLLLVSSKFLETITWDKIKTILIDQKIQNIEENFLSLLYLAPDQNQLSAALIESHEDNENLIVEPKSVPEVNQEVIIPVNPTPPIIPKKGFSDSIFVRHQSSFKVSNRKKIQILIALILIMGLFISCYFGFRKNQSAKTESNFQSLKIELEQKLNNITVVKSLNVETAYQTAKEAEKLIDNMTLLKIHSSEVSQYRSQVDAILSQTGDSENFSPQMVYDTSLIVSQPSFSKIIFSKQNLYLLDSTKGRLDSFNPQEKSTKNIIISDAVKSSDKILIDSNNLYLVINNKINLIEKNNLSVKLDLNLLEFSPTITDVQFWNGSLYILDNNNQSVWKLTPSSSGFSSPQNWLKNDAKLELGANSMGIDSRIWVLTESGQINLYTSGVKDNFKQNQSINFTKTSSLNTDTESDFLVFIDDSKYIYVFKKNGEFNSKFNLSNFKVLDIAFDSINKTIYFLSSDQKIYKITL